MEGRTIIEGSIAVPAFHRVLRIALAEENKFMDSFERRSIVDIRRMQIDTPKSVWMKIYVDFEKLSEEETGRAKRLSEDIKAIFEAAA